MVLYVVVSLGAFLCLGMVSLVGLAFLGLGVWACIRRQILYGLAGIVLGLITVGLIWALIVMVAGPLKDLKPPLI
jgi:hypothetical protein